jgi:hypothetical protein
MTQQTQTEKDLRAQIAAEIAKRFGHLAPYKLVQEFVRHGPEEVKQNSQRSAAQ